LPRDFSGSVGAWTIAARSIHSLGAHYLAIAPRTDPTYPFALFCRVITISLETIRIVRSLPSLDILDLVTAASVTPTGASEIEPAMEDV